MEIFDLILSLPGGGVCIGEGLVLKRNILSGWLSKKKEFIKRNLGGSQCLWNSWRNKLKAEL